MRYLRLHILYILWSKFLGQGTVYKPTRFNRTAGIENVTYESTKHKAYVSPRTPTLIIDEQGAVLASEVFIDPPQPFWGWQTANIYYLFTSEKPPQTATC